jgi:hypothetical protein
MDPENLLVQMSDHIALDTEINIVSVYRCPLKLTKILKRRQGYFFHVFVIIETKVGFMSVEKDQTAVTVQMSMVKDDLLKTSRHHERLQPVVFVTSAAGKGTIRDLFQMLLDREFVSRPYGMWRENCKFLVSEVYGESNGEGLRLEVGRGKELPHPLNSRKLDSKNDEDVDDVDEVESDEINESSDEGYVADDEGSDPSSDENSGSEST